MSIQRQTEITETLFGNIFLPNNKGISAISTVDFYAGLGYIYRITGATGGATKISLTTPAYSSIDRIPLEAIVYDDTPTVLLHEAGSTATGGSAKTPLNVCRCSANTSLVTCKTGVTYADNGTLLETVSASRKNIPSLGLWYLKPETQYVITFSKECNYTLEWAEIPLT